MTSMASGAGDAAFQETRADKGGQPEVTAWSNAASDCWSKCGSGAAAESSMSLAAGAVAGKSGDLDDKNNWMEGRVEARREEEAARYGLDPSKASWEAILEARGSRGTADNVGRIDRMRQAEAKQLGLPSTADWEQVDIARVQARKAELEGKYGQK